MTEWKTRRFWDRVEIVEEPGGFGIALDGRPVRTPGKHSLVVPSRALADGIANEWREVDGAIEPQKMPFTGLANAAIERVAPRLAVVAAELAEYAETDLLSYRAGHPAELAGRQRAAWDPVLDWAARTHGGRLKLAEGVMPVEQDAREIAALVAAGDELDPFEMTAFFQFVTHLGSYILALWVLDDPARAEAAWQASRIDEDFQTEEWGVDAEAADAAEAKKTDFLKAAQFLRAARAR